MRDYEIVYIFDSALEEEEIESKLGSYHGRITGEGSGEITAVEDWGKRQLAYPIEGQENGRYVVAQFSADPGILEEFGRRLNLDGDLLRHLVVLHEGELPVPPSARRPEAGPEEEEEEGEGEESGSEEDEGEEESEPEEDGAEEPSGEDEGDDSATDEDEESGGDGSAENGEEKE